MKLIQDTEFGGERPLFGAHDLRLENVVIRTGESAIKECSNIRVDGLVSSPLVHTGDTFVMDYDGLERKAADPAVKLMILCTPHNLAGRVLYGWTAAKL